MIAATCQLMKTAHHGSKHING